jgi:hypothetical protein
VSPPHREPQTLDQFYRLFGAGNTKPTRSFPAGNSRVRFAGLARLQDWDS